MQTNLDTKILDKTQLKAAEKILRSCVHCGFCTAVCPTYQLLGNELDSPRGRIYLIKQILEGKEVGAQTYKHLERCLTCRSCETTCPSGVDYYALLHAGKAALTKSYQPGFLYKTKQNLVRKYLSSGKIFNLGIKAGSFFKPILPNTLKRQLPDFKLKSMTPNTLSANTDKILLLGGCVQPALTPTINNATIKILEKLSVKVMMDQANSCCGAIDYHMGAENAALIKIKTNIDRWHKQLENGASTIISNASGCGAMVKDYAQILSGDSEYKTKAEYIVQHTQDISEYLADKDLSMFATNKPKNIVFHPPCSLQHWQGITGMIENILTKAGHNLLVIDNAHLCCGSAGTYSIMQPEISNKLKQKKLNDLSINQPDEIVSANVGCIVHLQSSADLTVRHWLELLAEAQD